MVERGFIFGWEMLSWTAGDFILGAGRRVLSGYPCQRNCHCPGRPTQELEALQEFQNYYSHITGLTKQYLVASFRINLNLRWDHVYVELGAWPLLAPTCDNCTFHRDAPCITSHNDKKMRQVYVSEGRRQALNICGNPTICSSVNRDITPVSATTVHSTLH